MDTVGRVDEPVPGASVPREPSVEISLQTIYDKVLEIDKKVDTVPRTLNDHEMRLRRMELVLAMVAFAVLGGGVWQMTGIV
jgi:hypothetical protein